MQEIEELDKKKVKTVGISFGHQAIAQALGGHVTRNPKVRFSCSPICIIAQDLIPLRFLKSRKWRQYV